MNQAGIVNLVGYPLVTVVSWLIVIGILPWGGPRFVAEVLGIVMPAVFLGLYIPMIRKHGLHAVFSRSSLLGKETKQE